MPAIFIRAPLIEEVGSDVEVLAWATAPRGGERRPVVCRQGAVLACAFHPELTPDRRLHSFFLAMVTESVSSGGGESPGVTASVAG